MTVACSSQPVFGLTHGIAMARKRGLRQVSSIKGVVKHLSAIRGVSKNNYPGVSVLMRYLERGSGKFI